MDRLFKEFCSAVDTPSDINEHLQLLFDLTSICEAVVEIGVRTAVSTRAILAGMPKEYLGIDLEITREAQDIVNIGHAAGINASLLKGNSHEVDIPECDLLFIDSDHTYNCLKVELERHGNRAKRFIAFHDTTIFASELMPAIQQFMKANPHWKLNIRKHNNNGFLVLERAKEV